jgi:hypothetical protein
MRDHDNLFPQEVPQRQEYRTQEGERRIERDIEALDLAGAASAKPPQADEAKAARVTMQERVPTC